MSVVIGLRWLTPRAAPDAMTAAVEIYDQELKVVARTSLGPAVTEVELAGPGSYLVSGWSAENTRIQHVVRVGSVTPPAITLAPGVEPRSVEPVEPDGEFWSDHPALVLAGVNDDLRHGIGIDLPPNSGTVDLPGPSGGQRLLTIMQEHWPPITTVAPDDVDLEVGVVAGRWLVRPAPGSTATLLAYLERGDLVSAGIITDLLIQERPDLNSRSSLQAVAIGYALLRHGDQRAADWITGLGETLPGLLDVAVLRFDLAMREGGPTRDQQQALLASAMNQVPMLPGGEDTLISSLRWLTYATEEFNENARNALRDAMRRQSRRESSPLTTFIHRRGSMERRGGSARPIRGPVWTLMPPWHLPPLSVERWRAASTDADSRQRSASDQWTSPDARVTCRWTLSLRDLTVTVTSADSPDGNLCRISVSGIDYLIVTGEPGASRSLHVRVRDQRVDLAIRRAFLSGASLSVDDVEAVERSIAATPGAELGGWLRIASERPPDDPLRTAILHATGFSDGLPF